MKKVKLSDLEKQYHILEYQELYRKIRLLIDQNKLKPLKAAGLNGKHPALYLEYWVVEEPKNMSALEEELRYSYLPAISTDYYLRHLLQYEKDRQWVWMLNDYLRNHAGRLAMPMSMNERSFDIWHREKFLKEEQGSKILKRCAVEETALNFYPTSEPMSYYVSTRQTPQNILIIENKDTFYTLRKCLIAGHDRILGEQIGTLIYGAGKGIWRSFEDFANCAEPYMRQQENRLLYFGDLDYEGIRIYEQLADTCLEEYHIEVFVPAYQKMLQKAKQLGVDSLPFTKEGQNRNIGTRFLNYFSIREREIIQMILAEKRYIPQEILSMWDLEKCNEI